MLFACGLGGGGGVYFHSQSQSVTIKPSHRLAYSTIISLIDVLRTRSKSKG